MKLWEFEKYVPVWAIDPEDLTEAEITADDIDLMMKPPALHPCTVYFFLCRYCREVYPTAMTRTPRKGNHRMGPA